MLLGFCIYFIYTEIIARFIFIRFFAFFALMLFVKIPNIHKNIAQCVFYIKTVAKRKTKCYN